jgi:branched-chain amino acid transport system substrate-binding protein
MNSTAIKEAVAVGFPREKMFGVWWAGAEPDVLPAGEDAKGYNALAMNPSGQDYEVLQQILTTLYDKGQGATSREQVGEVLYNRGMIDAMLRVEAVRAAMTKVGNRPVSGEEVRAGIESLDLDEADIKKLGFEGLVRPIKVTCADHEGSRSARIHQWDGKKWQFVSDWIEADERYLRPKVEAAAAAYAKEKNITPASCS